MEIDGLLPSWARNFSSPPNKLTERFFFSFVHQHQCSLCIKQSLVERVAGNRRIFHMRLVASRVSM